MTAALVGRAQRSNENRLAGTTSARLRTPEGHWLLLSAAVQRSFGSAPPLTSLVVSPAQPRQIAGLIVEAFNLTPREQQVTWAVGRGLSNPEVATKLGLSAHTVRDQLKTVFAKTEVTSRGELVAKVFADRYDPAELHDFTVYRHW
jgi:DNA-binding CsgD family transcriptional regulator